MLLNPYLDYNGNCREAFEFYRACFGVEFDRFLTYGEGPDMPGATDEHQHLILHASLPLGSSTLMGSDVLEPVAVGNYFSVSLNVDSREEADDLHAKLSEGGFVEMPMEDQFWGSYFGRVTDRFGLKWMISYDAPEG